MRAVFAGLAGALGGVVGISLTLVFGIGGLYWLWVSIQIGSFFMFLVGVFPVTLPVTGPVGAWMMFFGPPDWILRLFG